MLSCPQSKRSKQCADELLYCSQNIFFFFSHEEKTVGDVWVRRMEHPAISLVRSILAYHYALRRDNIKWPILRRRPVATGAWQSVRATLHRGTAHVVDIAVSEQLRPSMAEGEGIVHWRFCSTQLWVLQWQQTEAISSLRSWLRGLRELWTYSDNTRSPSGFLVA